MIIGFLVFMGFSLCVVFITVNVVDFVNGPRLSANRLKNKRHFETRLVYAGNETYKPQYSAWNIIPVWRNFREYSEGCFYEITTYYSRFVTMEIRGERAIDFIKKIKSIDDVVRVQEKEMESCRKHRNRIREYEESKRKRKNDFINRNPGVNIK